MKIYTSVYGICCIGKIKELKECFSFYPPDTTLKEFIRLHLH